MKSMWTITLDFDNDYSYNDVVNYLDSCLDFAEIVDYKILGGV